jgi:hypothetical protein
MTRKDYQRIADGIASALSRVYDLGDDTGDRITAQAGIWLAAREVATMLAVDNDRFDRERFLEACKVDEAFAAWQMMVRPRSDRERVEWTGRNENALSDALRAEVATVPMPIDPTGGRPWHK